VGVTIHYRGTLNNIDQFPQLREELVDIAAALRWQSQQMDDDWTIEPTARFEQRRIVGHLGLKGVQLCPHPDAEALTFFFDRSGTLQSPAGVAFRNGRNPEEAWVSTKTQFAPPDIHVRIIGLLKYVKRKFINDLTVSDEGQYWETGSWEGLIQRMAVITAEMNRLEGALSTEKLGDLSGLTGDQIADLIERLLREQL
jgi:hypothetical protein